jgi:hypothetical protein
MIRFSLILCGLLGIATSGMLVHGAATPDMTMTDAQKHRAYRPYVAAATDCLARAILETPIALQRAREGAWTEAVRLTGPHCAPVVGRMIFAHHELYDSGADRDSSRQASTDDLPGALAARLRTELDRVTGGGGQQARNQGARAVPPSLQAPARLIPGVCSWFAASAWARLEQAGIPNRAAFLMTAELGGAKIAFPARD